MCVLLKVSGVCDTFRQPDGRRALADPGCSSQESARIGIDQVVRVLWPGGEALFSGCGNNHKTGWNRSDGRCRGLSSPYRAACNQVLPHARQIADPFHVVRLANDRLDQVRRRTQQETLGHRGRKGDPLYQIRRGSRQVGAGRSRGGCKGDPLVSDPAAAHPCFGTARHRRRSPTNPTLPTVTARQLASDRRHESCPPEVNQLGRTLARRRRPDHQLASRREAQPEAPALTPPEIRRAP